MLHIVYHSIYRAIYTIYSSKALLFLAYSEYFRVTPAKASKSNVAEPTKADDSHTSTVIGK